MRRNRRFVSALLAVCTAMTAFSCGSKKPADSSEADHSDSTTTAAQTTAEAYTLPDAVESKTPIGCKLVFCKWKNSAGEEFMSCDLVYQSVQH